MTHTQVFWASQHDWYIHFDETGLYVLDYDGATYFETLWTGTFKQLREWAGY